MVRRLDATAIPRAETVIESLRRRLADAYMAKLPCAEMNGRCQKNDCNTPGYETPYLFASRQAGELSMDVMTICLALSCAALLGAFAALAGCIKASTNRKWKSVGVIELFLCALLSIWAFFSARSSGIDSMWLEGAALLFGMSGILTFAKESRLNYSKSNLSNLILTILATLAVFVFVLK